MGGSIMTRRLSDGCCLSVAHLSALVLAPLLAAALAPLLLPLGELHPEAARVVLLRVPKNFTIEVLTAGSDGGFPLARIRERYTRRNLPVVLRPLRRACTGSSSASSRASSTASGGAGSTAATIAKLTTRTIPVRVRPQHAQAGVVPLSALVFGSAENDADGFYQSEVVPWSIFVADKPLIPAVGGAATAMSALGEADCACYAARVSVADDVPELRSLLRLPRSNAHPLASTVGDPYPPAPVIYASHGRGESTPIHFDEEENWLYILRGRKHVVLYEPHAATHGHLPRDEVYRTTSTVPPHTAEERTAVEVAFPSLRRAKPVYLTLDAGEALYIPAFWWHGLIAVASGGSAGGGASGTARATGEDACPGSVLHAASEASGVGLSVAAMAVGPAVMSVAYWSEPSQGKFRSRRKESDPAAAASARPWKGLD